MLKRISFISLLFFAVSAFAATKTAEPQNMETEFGIKPAPTPAAVAATAPAPMPTPVIAEAKAPEPAPTPAPAPAAATPASVQAPAPAPKAKPAPASKDDAAPPYHYAYVPDESLDRAPDYGKVTQAGHRGIFFMSFVGQAVFYKDYNRGTPGFDVEAGFQFNLFKYLSLAAALTAGYKRGFVTGDKFYPFGVNGQLRARLLPWLYPFFEGGFECIKLARSGWEPPSKIIGGGFMIRLGYADKKAEYNMYKAVGITRIMLILGFDYDMSSSNKNIVPDAEVFKIGMSLEF